MAYFSSSNQTNPQLKVEDIKVKQEEGKGSLQEAGKEIGRRERPLTSRETKDLEEKLVEKMEEIYKREWGKTRSSRNRTRVQAGFPKLLPKLKGEESYTARKREREEEFRRREEEYKRKVGALARKFVREGEPRKEGEEEAPLEPPKLAGEMGKVGEQRLAGEEPEREEERERVEEGEEEERRPGDFREAWRRAKPPKAKVPEMKAPAKGIPKAPVGAAPGAAAPAAGAAGAAGGAAGAAAPVAGGTGAAVAAGGAAVGLGTVGIVILIILVLVVIIGVLVYIFLSCEANPASHILCKVLGLDFGSSLTPSSPGEGGGEAGQGILEMMAPGYIRPFSVGD